MNVIREQELHPIDRARQQLETTASMIAEAMLGLSLHRVDKRFQELSGGELGFVFKGTAGEAVMGCGGVLRTITGPDGVEYYSSRRDRVVPHAGKAMAVASRLLDEMMTVWRQCVLSRG